MFTDIDPDDDDDLEKSYIMAQQSEQSEHVIQRVMWSVALIDG